MSSPASSRSVSATFDFADRVLLVTGGARGIGFATADYFLRCGARIVLADVDERAGTEAARSLDPSGSRAVFHHYDAQAPADAQGVVERCMAAFGHIDFLVPCAAVFEDHLIDGMPDALWTRTISINLDGVFYLIRSAIPKLADGGAIVNLASQAAHAGGSIEHGHYGATKGALLALTRTLAKELGPRIRVNAVSPGTIVTPMVERILAGDTEQALASVPLGRRGQAREVASVIAFLCSEAASFITGETVMVNGGAYMGG